VNNRAILDATSQLHTGRLSFSATPAGQNLVDERFRGCNKSPIASPPHRHRRV
jgi:hypothetical protein